MVTIVIGIFGLGQATFAGESYRLISAQNAKGDLTGENWIERIILLWHAQDGAITYLIYRASSVKAPWVEVAKKDEIDVRSFGGYEDITDLALTNDLCYKVEAVNEVGQLVRVYESVCVPKSPYRR
jgi:hypothetical protein